MSQFPSKVDSFQKVDSYSPSNLSRTLSAMIDAIVATQEHVGSAELGSMTLPAGFTIEADGEEYGETGHSYQIIGVDLNLAAGAGSDTLTDPKFLAAMMGNVLGDELTETANYLAGVIGAYSITGAQSTQYPTAGVMGVAFDGVTVDAIVMAVLDGDDGGDATRAGAMFGVRINNNNVLSGVNYGLDLYGPANANYTGGGVALAVTKAEIRLTTGVCWLTGAGVPASGANGLGDNYAAKGSLYTDYTNGNLYIQAGLISAPDWKLVTRAA